MPEPEGGKNVYVCQSCGHGTVTVNAVEGTTPFQIGCTAEGCGGAAYSQFYRVPPDAGEPTHEWYRPTPGQARRMDRRWPGTADHVQMGGLMLRERKTRRAVAA
jgi:hypothetical protein